jgi:casein kinase 1
MILCVIFVFF